MCQVNISLLKNIHIISLFHGLCNRSIKYLNFKLVDCSNTQITRLCAVVIPLSGCLFIINFCAGDA